MKAFVHASVLCVGVAGVAMGAEADGVAFPRGYREWTHVKSMIIQPGHPLFDAFGGIHHLYANPPAMTGYRTGKFPDGSVIVFDLLAVAPAEGSIAEGARKVLGVMQRDRARFKATGGWGFEAFPAGDAQKRAVGANAVSACFACHEGQKERDYVFSAWRD